MTTLQLPTGRAICYSGYRHGQSPDSRVCFVEPGIGRVDVNRADHRSRGPDSSGLPRRRHELIE